VRVWAKNRDFSLARQTRKKTARSGTRKPRAKGNLQANRLPGFAPSRKTPTTAHGRVAKRLVRYLLIAAVLVCLTPVLLTFLYLPSSIHPVSTLMFSERLKGNKVTRTWVDFDDISPFVYQSVMMSEDGRFCAHSGVDWGAINIVIDDLIEGERPRGASTIAMQSVKNLYLWNSRSYLRKGLEVPLALLVDAVWSKRRLMEIYLNIAEWGPGIYGIEAAARHHFKRSAKNLSRKQAALLAVSLPNPILRNPRRPKRGLRRLARLVERRAKASGAYIRCLRAG